MHIKDCKSCRKDIFKQAKDEFMKHEYAIFTDAAYTFACYATTAALAVQVRRGRSKEYIQKLYDDMVMMFDTSTLFGKEIKLTDIMHDLERDYGIDFKRINVHLESEKEFIKGVKEK